MNFMFLPTQIVETSHHSQNLSFLQLHEVWWSRKNWQAWHPLLPPGSSLILLRKSDWGWQHIVAFLSSNWIYHLSKFKMGDSRNCFLWVDFRQSFSQQRAVTIIYPPFNISVAAESWMRAAAKEGQKKITIFSSPPPHPCMHPTLCNHVCNSLTISGIRCTRNDNIKGLGRVAQPAKSLFKYELQELCRRLIECRAAHSISVTFSDATPPLQSGAKT